MFGHSSVLHKHHWSLNPALPPCQGQLAVLVQTKYMDVCVCAGRAAYLCTVHQHTFIYPRDPPLGLVCQCLCMMMFDYVSQSVYINEMGI